MTNKILLIIFVACLFSFTSVFASIPAVIAERESIRIAAFYYLDHVSPRLQKIISEQLVPAAISYYQATLKVNREERPIVVDEEVFQSCVGAESQESLKKEVKVEADLVLFVLAQKNSKLNPDRANSFALAIPCHYHHQTNRFVTGSLYYNPGKDFETESFATAYEALLLTTLHEMGHILGFRHLGSGSFINPLTGEKLQNTSMKKEVNGMMVTVMTLDPLTQRLRDYFNCPTLEGAYMEQQGVPGSVNEHFESRIFMNELMTARMIGDQRISEFYLAFLEGTGWYTPNYNMSEPIFWGKGKGCEFLDTKCINSARESNFPDYFCTDFGKWTCSFDRGAYGFCGSLTLSKDYSLKPAFNYWGDGTVLSVDSFSDNCPYRFPTSDIVCQIPRDSPTKTSNKEYFGPQSACFIGSLDPEKIESPYCLKQSCKKIGSDQYVVNIEIEDHTVVCEKEGPMKVDGDGGYIDCPDPLSFCTIVIPYFCRRGCMGRGTCVDNQCVCNEGYYGSDCSFRNVAKTQAEGLPIEFKDTFDIPFGLIYLVLISMILLVCLCGSRNAIKDDQNEYETGLYAS